MTRSDNLARFAGRALRWQSDARIVSLCRAGQDRAFEEVVRRYRPALAAYAAGFVPSHRAEDVVQAALIKAHAALGRNDDEIHLRAWLYTIVRNTALNDIRDERPHEQLDEGIDGVPQPPHVAEQRAEVGALVSRLKSLPDPQREAIVMHELEGRSHAEIAMRIGATRAGVRGLIYRARCGLREGVGMLIPLSLLRSLLAGGSPAIESAAGGAALAGGGAAGAKAGVGAIIAALVVGSGVAIERGAHRGSDRAPSGVQRVAGGGDRTAIASSAPTGVRTPALPAGDDHGSRGPGPAAGPDGSGSGPGDQPSHGQDHSGEDVHGPPRGKDGHAGPGDPDGGGDHRPEPAEPDDHGSHGGKGPGPGERELEVEVDEHHGESASESEHEGGSGSGGTSGPGGDDH